MNALWLQRHGWGGRQNGSPGLKAEPRQYLKQTDFGSGGVWVTLMNRQTRSTGFSLYPRIWGVGRYPASYRRRDFSSRMDMLKFTNGRAPPIVPSNTFTNNLDAAGRKDYLCTTDRTGHSSRRKLAAGHFGKAEFFSALARFRWACINPGLAGVS